jgi:hypothetical protein
MSAIYPVLGGVPEQGLPSPMSGTDFSFQLSICLSFPFVNCSIE